MFSVFAIAMAILALQALFTVLIVTAFAGGAISKTLYTVLSYVTSFVVGVTIALTMPSIAAVVALLVATIGADYAIRQYAVMRIANGC